MSHVLQTEGKLLAWNSLLNLLTSLLIVLLNILFVPMMLHSFGSEFYGVLSVTWMVLANLAWLDFGFSRASARYVAQELARGERDQAALWTCTAVLSQTCLGLIGAITVWALAPAIVSRIHVQSDHRDLVILTLKLFAFSIPLDLANRSITGVMQAGQRFDWVNGLGLANTLCTFVIYSIGIARGGDFKSVIYGMFALRILNLFSAYWGATRVLPALKSLAFLNGLSLGYWTRARALIQYGWWVASASVIGPLLLFFDQWMISMLAGVALLPYYTIPSNLLWRLGIFPTSLTTTLFPAFTAMEANTEWKRIEDYFVRAHRYLLTAIVPSLFVLFVWGQEILRVWLGIAFAEKASMPLRILVFGFLIGLLAPLSGALLEGVGRPDILVKVYLLELPFNVIIVWFLTKHYGISGAALSYTIRTAIETIILWVVIYFIVPFSSVRLLREGLLRPAVSVAAFIAVGMLVRNPSIRSVHDLAISAVALIAYMFAAFTLVFDDRDRMFTVDFLKSKAGKLADRVTARRVLNSPELS